MLGTPNNGGLYNVGDIADYLAVREPLDLDFIQLSENSSFMKELEVVDSDVKWYTVAGNVDGKGDGLVLANSVAVGENNIEVECNHLTLMHPSLCPEAYLFVKKSLSEGS